MIQKNDLIKSWEKLEDEVNKSHLTSLICCQDFAATKNDSYEDNGWGEIDEEDNFPIGEYENQDYQTTWKLDTMFRMLDENLDYGKFKETEDECDREEYKGMYHSILMDIRATIADEVAEEWVKADGKVSDIESAQKLADELVAKIDFDKFVPSIVA